MNREALARKIRDRLEMAHGPRLKGVVLYGSFARGDEAVDSDIDVLVLLDGPVSYGPDLEKNILTLYPLSMELGHPISAKPVSEEAYANEDCPLYNRVKSEGIQA